MSFLSFFLGEKKKTASVAKERLQIILAHERNSLNTEEPDYLPALQRELVEAQTNDYNRHLVRCTASLVRDALLPAIIEVERRR